ncbi:hypothetical protein [Polyangium jinanense]|uniref:Uncharacterized protein n=1 Tax=Polyangium jinanense TaxID=2829994 RepID=A0A9X3XCF9_9BACT|nr:hypothetical protein [Polyangium jinanense]MDC3961873.1 hypothetical protein [Polyangium jinanense]MDC3987809.1 hypothetical protein [Polyangium jinanense]
MISFDWRKQSGILAILLALGTVTNAAAAKDLTNPYERYEPKVEEPPPRPYQVNGFFEMRYSIGGAESGVAGLEFSYLAHPHVRLGAALSLPIGVGSAEYCWERGFDCTFNYVAPIGFVEAHARPKAVFDPWARAGIGVPFIYSHHDPLRPDLRLRVEGMFIASLGFDIHVGPFVAGVYGTANLFTGDHSPVFGPGVRIGGQF